MVLKWVTTIELCNAAIAIKRFSIVSIFFYSFKCQRASSVTISLGTDYVTSLVVLHKMQ